MGSINLNGTHLYYEQEGHGPPLVLIAGYTADVSAWMRVRRKLARHFKLFMFDNRGAGRSDSPDTPYTIDHMADDAMAFIEALGLHRPHILGHSMGGAIAQTLAFHHPLSIGRLVLANTFIKMRAAPACALRYFFKMRAQGMPQVAAFEGSMPWLFSSALLHNQPQIDALLQLVQTYPFPQGITGQKRQLEAIMQFNSKNWFRHIACPTLVIQGGEDIICPGDSQLLADGIAGARLVTFDHQAHMAPIESPDEFAEAVLSFLIE